MPKELYFVDSIFTPREEGISSSVVALQSTTEKNSFIIRSFEQEQLRMYNHQGTIKEGWYVYFDKESQELFGYGNLSLYARERFREYYELRNTLSDRYISPEREDALVPKWFQNNDTNVVSYHVNVGHGNCSIILIENCRFYQIWMVDCSLLDKTNHWHNYQANLDTTFKAILERLGKPESAQIHIDRFFLTHAHHDHYNGIKYLIKNNYIDNKTLCYINLYYQMAGETYLYTLKELENAKVMFIEPISNNSVDAIKFLHPECRVYRSEPTIKQNATNYRIVNSPINNSSTVIMFKIGKNSMVFTGDLEQNGFKHMTRGPLCSPLLYNSNYYTISHHGSINGHPDMPCMNINQPIPTPLYCIKHSTRKAIIMGRDKAYNGIYSPTVISYWNSFPGVLEYTEKAPHYLELDWGSGNVAYK